MYKRQNLGGVKRETRALAVRWAGFHRLEWTNDEEMLNHLEWIVVDNGIDRHEWMDDDEERMHRSIGICVMGQWRCVRAVYKHIHILTSPMFSRTGDVQ